MFLDVLESVRVISLSSFCMALDLRLMDLVCLLRSSICSFRVGPGGLDITILTYWVVFSFLSCEDSLVKVLGFCKCSRWMEEIFT